LYLQDAATRARNLVRMQAVAAQVLREVPDARLAQDSPGRETDVAIDHSEFTHLPGESIQRVVDILRGEGMSATVSSIHINGWFGDHDRRVGARWILQALWNRDLDQELQRWVYVGDSTNDQRMFEVFDNSVGVANIRRFLPELVHLPRFVTLAERGAGFAEVVDALLAARAEAGPA
nr:HAD family hydrolase [Rhodoferax sp.]